MTTANPTRWRAVDYLPVLTMGLLIAIRRAELPLGDADVLWGARAGVDMLESGSLPRVDRYSWTAHGVEWVPNSWAWNGVLGLAYRMGGVLGIWLLAVVLIPVLAGLVGVAASRMKANPYWTAGLFAAVGSLLLPFLYPRPHLISYILLLAVLLLTRPLLFGSRRTATSSVAAIAGLQLLWTNLHSSAILGPLLLLAFGLGLILEQQVRPHRASVQRLGTATALGAVACLLTPYGAAPLLHIPDVRAASAGLITEWRPPGFATPLQVLGLISVLIGIAALTHAARRRSYSSLAALGIVTIAAMSAIRFAPLPVLLAVPELAVLAGRLDVRAAFLKRAFVFGCAFFALFLIPRWAQFGKLDESIASTRLIDQVPNDCRVLNDYISGGTLILLRPDTRVAWDGRNDVYGRERLIWVSELLAGRPDAPDILRNNSVDCVLALRSDGIVPLLLKGSWRQVDSDGERTLLVRS